MLLQAKRCYKSPALGFQQPFTQPSTWQPPNCPRHPWLCAGAWAFTTQHPAKPTGAGKGHQPFCYGAQLQLLYLLLHPLIANEETFVVETLLKLQAGVTVYVANTEDTKREKGGKKKVSPPYTKGKRPCDICRKPLEVSLKGSQVMTLKIPFMPTTVLILFP